jgi:hypothetical protein
MQSHLKSSTRVQMGVASGFVGSVAMGLSLIVITGLNLLTVPWFSMVGRMFGTGGSDVDVAIYGLVFFLAIGIIGGLVYAFGFHNYTVNKGLGIAALGLIFTALILSVESISPLSGTLFQIGLGSTLTLFVPLAVSYIIWGIVVALVAKRYVD